MSSAEVATLAELDDRRDGDVNSEATKVQEYAAFDVLRFTGGFYGSIALGALCAVIAPHCRSGLEVFHTPCISMHG